MTSIYVLEHKNAFEFGLNPVKVFAPRGSSIIVGEVGITFFPCGRSEPITSRSFKLTFDRDSYATLFNLTKRGGQDTALSLSYACPAREHGVPHFPEISPLPIYRAALRHSRKDQPLHIPYGVQHALLYEDQIAVPERVLHVDKNPCHYGWVLSLKQMGERLVAFRKNCPSATQQVWLKALFDPATRMYRDVTHYRTTPDERGSWMYVGETRLKTTLLERHLLQVVYDLETLKVVRCYDETNGQELETLWVQNHRIPWLTVGQALPEKVMVE